jgi:hypothetical protein
MKKRILLLFALLSISLINAQTIGDTFTVDDLIYDITDLASVGTANTVTVSNKNRGNLATPYDVPYPNAVLTIPTTVTGGTGSLSYTITSIAADAFQDNGNITTLTINATTLPLSFRTFEGCSVLETVSLPNLTTGLMGNLVFQRCPELLSFSAPNFTGTFGNQNFQTCSKLTTVTVPGVTSLGNNNFDNCDDLITISLPNLVTAGNNTFIGCDLLDTANLPLLETVGQRTFYNNASLTTVTLTNLTSANNEMFYLCPSLVTIDLPSLTSAGNNMFWSCTSLETATMPNLATAGFQMFKFCSALTSVDLSSLATNNYQMFFGCTSLESIDLPLLVGTNNRCFEDCTSLKYVNLPSLVNLHQGSFDNTGLESIVFPATFTTFLGADTHFQNSSSLKHIGFASATPIDLGGAYAKFTGIAANAVIVVPSGSAATYDAAGGWTDFSIVEGTLSKTVTDITYSRNLSTDDDWFMVSSPVSDERYNNTYVANNSIDATGTITDNRAIATYTTSANTWAYMQVGNDLPFTPGIGYSVKREDAEGAGNISFTGTALTTGDVNGVTVSTATDGFNLLGNPYLTNMNSGTFLTANANLAGEIYLYNESSDNYETYVSGVNKILAAGQGFFVKANSGADVDFTTAIQTNSATGVFQKTAISEIKLFLNSGKIERFAKIFFTSSATTGFDKGWDGETFTGVSNEFDVFTQLLENNIGKNYQVQSLPNANLETTVIPVGLKAATGKEITFSAETLNLPSGVNVFLEDRDNNTFTRLNEANAKYEVTLSENLNGTGRFFIHTSAKSALSADSAILEGVSVYKLNASRLRIAGLSQGKATVKLFNVLGKQMIKTSFDSTGSDEISLSKLATGVYIVQLETENGKLNKKIILE